MVVDVLFVLLVANLGFVMKLIAMFRCDGCGSNWQFILSPAAAPTSLRRKNPADSPVKLLGRVFLCAIVFVVWEAICRTLIERLGLHGPLLGYLAVPSIYLLGEGLGPLVALVGKVFGRRFPFVLNAPLRSRNLAEFWGRRWNVWFSDWFRFVVFDRLRRRSVFALLLVFLISGVMHEWVINFSLWLVTGRSLFGTQMVYFLIQGFGLLLDRRIAWVSAGMRRAFAWLVIIGPVPLTFNEGMLRILHLWPN